MKPIKIKADATFLGTPGSLGFHHKEKYVIKARFYPDGSVSVSAGSIFSSLSCGYDSIKAFFANWRIDGWR